MWILISPFKLQIVSVSMCTILDAPPGSTGANWLPPAVSPSPAEEPAIVPVETDLDASPFISTLSLSGSEETLGKKLLLKLSKACVTRPTRPPPPWPPAQAYLSDRTPHHWQLLIQTLSSLSYTFSFFRLSFQGSRCISCTSHRLVGWVSPYCCQQRLSTHLSSSVFLYKHLSIHLLITYPLLGHGDFKDKLLKFFYSFFSYRLLSKMNYNFLYLHSFDISVVQFSTIPGTQPNSLLVTSS